MSREALNLGDTLFALTSGALPSGVAIVKVSGPKAFELGAKLCPSFKSEPGMSLAPFLDSKGTVLDEGILLSFKGPNSHTGEDTVEFHVHGSIAIVSALEYSLESLGARRAGRGEFSYRAFLNGKVTAEELEDLGDIFSASQEEALKRIYSRRDGSLEKKVLEFKETLIKVQAVLDTAVDFSDEYSNVVALASNPTTLTIQAINEIIQRYSTLRSSLELPKLVLAGKPNAGKSSLFNAILCRYRAIVHSEPGTTRDVIEEEILLGERRWKLVDTAGVREAVVETEKAGIEMGADYLSGAAYWLLIVDGTNALGAEDFELLERFQKIPHRIVWNKSDLAGWSYPKEEWLEQRVSPVSVVTGEGLGELIECLTRESSSQLMAGDLPTPTRTQVGRLKGVVEDLQRLKAALDGDQPPEYLAELNRRAIHRLEEVIGEVSVDDVLDRVFSEFCIGK